MTSERFVCYGAARNNVLATLLTLALAVKHLSLASVTTDRPAIEHCNPSTTVLAIRCIVLCVRSLALPSRYLTAVHGQSNRRPLVHLINYLLTSMNIE